MKDYVFTDLKKPAQRAVWATWAFAAMQVGSALVHIYQNTVINRFIDGQADVEALEQSDQIIGFSAIGFLIVLVIAFAINGRFLYLASRNAAAIHDDPKAIKPGWAVGWYFVPFANLWVPFTAMKQTWGRLIPSDSGVPHVITVWWLSWIGMNFYDGYLGGLTTPDNLPDYLTYNQGFIASGFLWIIPCTLFVWIIRRLAMAEHNPAEVFA